MNQETRRHTLGQDSQYDFRRIAWARCSKMVHRRSRQLANMHSNCGVSDVCPYIGATLQTNYSPYFTASHCSSWEFLSFNLRSTNDSCTKNIQRFGRQPDPVLLCHESHKLVSTCTTPKISHEFSTRLRCV